MRRVRGDPLREPFPGLELAIGNYRFTETAPRPLEVLRGASWATIVPGEIIARLGDRDARAGSGAFTCVDDQPGGGLLLRATERYAGYDDDAAAQVFELRPALLERVFVPTLPGSRPEISASGLRQEQGQGQE